MVLALLEAARGLFAVGLGALAIVAAFETLQGWIPVLALPLYGGTLLAAGEFGYWSFEMQMTSPQSSATIRRRTGVILSLVVVGAGASALLVAILELARVLST